MKGGERRMSIRGGEDIVEARLAARLMAEEIGFSGTDLVIIATAVSEIARNIVKYAKSGEVLVFPVCNSGRRGLGIVGRDTGPGIADLALALQEGYSTSRGLGMGLPGVRRLMDDFEIVSEVGKGTTITMKKWLRR